MQVLLEIVKIGVPALLLFITTLVLVKGFLKSQSEAMSGFLFREAEYRKAEGERRALEVGNANKQLTMPLRMQAYERLTLFCTRLELVKIILRTPLYGLSAKQLKNEIINSIEEEFVHNITQQMYVSDELWKIILLAKQEVINIVSRVYKDIEANAEGNELPASDFIDALSHYLEESPQMGYLQAQMGIKKEVALLF